MVILRFRSNTEVKDMLKKAKKMYKFSKEFKECLEEKLEDTDDEDYRYDDEEDEDERREMMENRRSNGGSYRRYRRSM